MVNQVRRIALASALGLGMVVASAGQAHAVTIEGRYNFTLGNVDVTFGNIDWTTEPGATTDLHPSPVRTYGTFDLSTALATRTGVFSGPEFGAIGFGALGTGLPALPEKIQDMADPVLVGGADSVPIGAGFTPNFFQLAEHPNWIFNETFLEAGSAPTIPFVVTELGGQSSITITIHGIAFDTATPGDISHWDAVISSQYNLTAAELEAEVVAGTLPINSWSGTFTATAVPEPATLLTFGFGALALVRKRRSLNK
jgi:hypothetical protein